MRIILFFFTQNKKRSYELWFRAMVTALDGLDWFEQVR